MLTDDRHHTSKPFKILFANSSFAFKIFFDVINRRHFIILADLVKILDDNAFSSVVYVIVTHDIDNV